MNNCVFIVLFLSCFYPLSAQNSAQVREIGAGRNALEFERTDPYTLQISAVVEKGNQIFVHLNNGTVWKHIRANPLKLGWLIGDQILIQKNGQGFALDNISFQGNATVAFDRLTREMLPTVSGNDEAGSKIYLDDGSQWTINWENRIGNRTWEWKKGDRIIISPLQNPSPEMTHLLIDIDRDGNASPALLIRRR